MEPFPWIELLQLGSEREGRRLDVVVVRCVFRCSALTKVYATAATVFGDSDPKGCFGSSRLRGDASAEELRA